MSVRRQLPVASPIAVGALPRAALAAIAGDANTAPSRAAVRALLGRKFGAAAVALTDSGTLALVLAIRMVVPPNGTIALPAYGCPDLLAASVFAGVRLRFYDLDPRTLSPDPDSVRAALARGAEAVVVAHWYGYPADVRAVTALARESGAVVIEDAAQHGEGKLDGAALGTTGPLTVLSFGRGKGTTAGSGGALLAIGATWSSAVEAWEVQQEPIAPRGMARPGRRDGSMGPRPAVALRDPERPARTAPGGDHLPSGARAAGDVGGVGDDPQGRAAGERGSRGGGELAWPHCSRR